MFIVIKYLESADR